MQVKCLLKRKASHGFDTNLDWVADTIQQQGKAILSAWGGLPYKFHGYRETDAVCLESADFGKPFGGGAENRGGRWVSASQADVLFILGGRGSILHWLQLQGDAPLVLNMNRSAPLFIRALRKKQLLDKNLSILIIHPRQDVTTGGTGWKGSETLNLSRFTNSELSEYTPRQIAAVASTLFAEH